jgi:hypothetical protein
MIDNMVVLKEGTVCTDVTGSYMANKCKFPLGASNLVIIGNDNECIVHNSRIVGKNIIIGNNNTNENGHYSIIRGNANTINGMFVEIQTGVRNKVTGTVSKDNGTRTIIHSWIPPKELSGCDYITQVACDKYSLPVETAQAMSDNQFLSYISMMTGLPIDFFQHLSVAPSHKRKRDTSDVVVRRPLPYATLPPTDNNDDEKLCAMCYGYLRTCVVIHEDDDGDSTGCLILCPDCSVKVTLTTCPQCRKPTKRIVRLANFDENILK